MVIRPAAIDWRGEIGKIGEQIIFDLLKRETNDVHFSEDKFDRYKDLIAATKTVEVKTQVPIKKYNAFAVSSNQIVKLMNVDRLFFVEIANGNFIRIYEALKPRLPFTKMFNNDVCYFFKLTDLHLYDTIEDESIASRLRSLTPSKYL
jgi:hypothetical protein